MCSSDLPPRRSANHPPRSFVRACVRGHGQRRRLIGSNECEAEVANQVPPAQDGEGHFVVKSSNGLMRFLRLERDHGGGTAGIFGLPARRPSPLTSSPPSPPLILRFFFPFLPFLPLLPLLLLLPRFLLLLNRPSILRPVTLISLPLSLTRIYIPSALAAELADRARSTSQCPAR